MKFSVLAPGAVSYQWESSCDRGKTWWAMFEDTAQSAEVTVGCEAFRDGRPFRCRVTFADGTQALSEQAWLAIGK
ncbi:hypothetical protein [Adlercreutzia sp. ZJ242]|uniref:hypothetical protein n=1 Tax=Adlercreutzia sp. ZJ242 TaxID=2709409 RepID=UPI0013EDF2DF|nr:hypothetical protein [Adlercreutzia sp. ZJ242]